MGMHTCLVEDSTLCIALTLCMAPQSIHVCLKLLEDSPLISLPPMEGLEDSPSNSSTPVEGSEDSTLNRPTNSRKRFVSKRSPLGSVSAQSLGVIKPSPFEQYHSMSKSEKQISGVAVYNLMIPLYCECLLAETIVEQALIIIQGNIIAQANISVGVVQ